jgi:flagellar hook assembly protein FlgD
VTPRGRNLALTVLTLAIVAFSTVAFVRTQMLKQDEAPIAGIRVDGRLTPGCDCPRENAKLSFTLERAQPITATIVGEDDEPVRTLLDGALRASGRETLSWDGTNDQGRVVPDGDYRLRVELAAPDRTITIPTDVQVESSTDAAGRTTLGG